MSWVWVEFYGFPPYELLDIFFSKWWLLKIKNKRPWANGLLVDIVKRCQVWMAQSLVNCKWSTKRVDIIKCSLKASLHYTVDFQENGIYIIMITSTLMTILGFSIVISITFLIIIFFFPLIVTEEGNKATANLPTE